MWKAFPLFAVIVSVVKRSKNIFFEFSCTFFTFLSFNLKKKIYSMLLLIQLICLRMYQGLHSLLLQKVVKKCKKIWRPCFNNTGLQTFHRRLIIIIIHNLCYLIPYWIENGPLFSCITSSFPWTLCRNSEINKNEFFVSMK